jgi:hypothetical protein
MAGLIQPTKPVRNELSLIQGAPEFGIGRTVDIVIVAKNPVVLPQQFLLAVPHGLLKVAIDPRDLALEVKLNHRHGAINGIEQTGLLLALAHWLRDITGEPEDSGDAVIGLNGHIRRIQPQAFTGFTAPWAPQGRSLPAGELFPELTMLGP